MNLKIHGECCNSGVLKYLGFRITLKMPFEPAWAANALVSNQFPVSEVTWLFCRPRFVTSEMTILHLGTDMATGFRTST